MKRIYIYLMLIIAVVSLTSCKKSYELTENAVLLEYGVKGEYGFQYVNPDGDKVYYYKTPYNIVIGCEDSSIKSKYTICHVYYDEYGDIDRIEHRKTHILKAGETIELHLSSGENEGYDYTGKYYKYLAWREVIYIYEGYNMYVDSSYFEQPN